MAPTESTIHSNFLLTPASLPTIISLKAFAELFPASQQKNPHIRTLYRDLQHSRALVTDAVAQSIAAEVKRGNAQRRAVVKARRRADRALELDDEVVLETALFGKTGNLPVSKPHSLASILPELESAVEDVEDEARRLDEESERLVEEMRSIVGGLSDLRYGRLANPQLREQVLEGLSRLENSCDTR